MSNAIENARKALKTYESPQGSYQYDADVLYEALRELLESVAVEHRHVNEQGWPDEYGDEIETRYVTPWERA